MRVIIAIQKDCPPVRVALRIELVTPNLDGGTQLITTLVLGDENKAVPIPATASAISIVTRCVPRPAKAKNSS